MKCVEQDRIIAKFRGLIGFDDVCKMQEFHLTLKVLWSKMTLLPIIKPSSKFQAIYEPHHQYLWEK